MMAATTFGPKDIANRAQAAYIISLLMHLDQTGSNRSSYVRVIPVRRLNVSKRYGRIIAGKVIGSDDHRQKLGKGYLLHR